MSLRLCTSTRRASLKVTSTLLSDRISETKPLPELGVGHDDVLVVVLAELVGFRVLLAVLGEELVEGGLLHHRPLLRGDGLGNVVLDVAPRLAERVDIPAGVALNATNLVLVLRNDDVRGIALALGAICLDVGADLVDLVFEHEVHSSSAL